MKQEYSNSQPRTPAPSLCKSAGSKSSSVGGRGDGAGDGSKSAYESSSSTGSGSGSSTSLTCCHGFALSSTAEDPPPTHDICGRTQELEKHEKFANYATEAGIPEIVEACLSYFTSGTPDLLPPFDEFAESLASKLGRILPLREEVEKLRELNLTLRQKIQLLEDTNAWLKSRRDAYEPSVEEVDTLDPNQFHPRLHPEPLDPVKINARGIFRNRDASQKILTAALGHMDTKEKANRSNEQMIDRAFTPTDVGSTSIATSGRFPPVKRDDESVEQYHGVSVPNPYKWFEDGSEDEISQFVSEQNAAADQILQGCEERHGYVESLRASLSYQRMQCPMICDGTYYYLASDETAENVPIAYMQKKNETPKTLLDFASVLCDNLELLEARFSEDGKILAYMIFNSDNSKKTLHFYDVVGKFHLPDVLNNVGPIFCLDCSRGVYYEVDTNAGRRSSSLRYPIINHHTFGKQQDEDIQLWRSDEDPDRVKVIKSIQPATDSFSDNLVIKLTTDGADDTIINHTVSPPDRSSTYKPDVIVEGAYFQYICNCGTLWYFVTDKYAEKRRIVEIKANHPVNSHWKWRTVVREEADKRIAWADYLGEHKLVICYREYGRHTLLVTDLESGKVLGQVPLEIGSIRGHYARRDSHELLFQFGSFLIPSRIYRLKVPKENKLELELFSDFPLPGNDPEIQKTAQVFYPSDDGELIPMFVIYSKGGKLCTGPTTCLLCCFGGFGLCVTPAFSSLQFTFLQKFDGLVAIPLVRGGGELGKNWHRAATRENKRKSVQDLVAAAEFLIGLKYTTPSQLFLEGTSHGGFLAAASVNLRPDLFAGAIIQSGILDLIRFPSHVSGKSWKEDFGDPREDGPDFQNCYQLSPLHNLGKLLTVSNRGPFPSFFLLVEKFDSQIFLVQSYKFISQLQFQIANNSAEALAILKKYCSVECPAIKPFTSDALNAQVNKEADILSFICHVVKNVDLKQGASLCFTPKLENTGGSEQQG